MRVATEFGMIYYYICEILSTNLPLNVIETTKIVDVLNEDKRIRLLFYNIGFSTKDRSLFHSGVSFRCVAQFVASWFFSGEANASVR